MSLSKLSIATVIPGTPAVPAQPYSRTCPASPPPGAPESGASSGVAGSTVVSTTITPIASSQGYGYPATVQYEVCNVYADGSQQCYITATLPGGGGGVSSG